MKYLKVLSVIFFSLIISCSNDETPPIMGEEEEENNPPIELAEEVEAYEASLVHDGLVLAVKNGGTEAFLVDKLGDKKFEWEFTSNLGNDFELLDNGKTIGMFKSETNTISFGGWGGIIKIFNENGDLEWEYEVNTSNEIAHHDVEMLPNGNVLFLVWERIDNATALQAGVNAIEDAFPEKLVEVNPNTNQVVWQWRSWDHIIQDFDSNAPNFGVIADNPSKIDINYDLRANGDYMHANGIDYDETNDIIYISVNFYSEIWVVDHSTTTSEAATSSGGNYNKGGDLLYRFGNPEVYDNMEGKRIFFNNHFPNLLENGQPGEGNMLVYVNSGDNILQSTVYELSIPEQFSLVPNQDNEPEIVWSFTDENLFHARISGAERLSNGNTLICEGDYGYWEVTETGDIAWKYNGDSSFWRGYGYDRDSPALDNLNITF